MRNPNVYLSKFKRISILFPTVKLLLEDVCIAPAICKTLLDDKTSR